MNEVRYASDKPKDCRYCYFWGGRNKGCELGEENCYYIIKEPANQSKSKCYDCCYGHGRKCVGYCIKDILMKGGENVGK